MKPRRVFVTLEMDSSLPISALRSMEFWNGRLLTKPEERVLQASANVARIGKPVNAGEAFERFGRSILAGHTPTLKAPRRGKRRSRK